jgi:glycosyltransferase involved in cell wall biosynthesis
VLVTSGRTLRERLRARHANAILIPNGADYELFSRAVRTGLWSDLPRPVVGFFGAFAEWLDRDWIARAAERFPRWSFVYVGREGFARTVSRKEWQALGSIPNIRMLPQVAPDVLAGYLAEFDVCIMPFRDLPVTRSMNAVKIYEYLAAGKPVVAPDLPETRPLADAGLVQVYGDAERSFELLGQAVTEGVSAKVEARQKFASANTWRLRVEQLLAILPT